LSIIPVSTYVRQIKIAKNNLSASAPVLRSTEVNGKIRFSGCVSASEETQQKRAERWLIELFSKRQTISALEIYRQGEKFGFSVTLLRTLKSTLGVSHRKIQGRLYWCPPFSIETSDSVTVVPKNRIKSESSTVVRQLSDTATVRTVSTVSTVKTKKDPDSCVDSSIHQGLGEIQSKPPREGVTEEPSWLKIDFQAVDSLVESDPIDISDEEGAI